MMKYFFKAIGILSFTGFLSIGAMAQQDNDKSRANDDQEIIIRKKGEKNTKVTVEITDGEVKVNGKPLSEFNDDNIIISKRRTSSITRAYTAPRSPFRGGAWNYNDNDSLRLNMTIDNLLVTNNKALLGVTTEKIDNGAKINSVTKGSAAEKAGLKENDVITKVGETMISSPEDLTKAVGKFKPQDKTVVTYRRDKKEQKVNVELGKRDDATTFNSDRNELFKNFNFDYNGARADVFGMARTGGPRLGIKAQDTEEGKGVTVLDVDDASAADKAGIKEGDIITEFDGKTVNSATELANAAKEAKDKNLMKVKLNRDGKSQELDVKIPKKLKTANL